ncbi:CPBP family glutamic-type intramembrane protease [Furfurilactobacillus sp. WILCCON 0119]
MTKCNLNRLWFIISTILLLIVSFETPGIGILIGKNSLSTAVSGKMEIPVLNLILLLIYLALAKYIWHIQFGLNLVKLGEYSKRINKMLWVVPTLIMILATIFYPSHLLEFLQVTDPRYVILGLVSSLIAAVITGYFEEIVFRGGIFGFLNSQIRSEKSILYSSLIAGLFFGVIHLSNLAGGASLAYTLAQVIYATAFVFLSE